MLASSQRREEFLDRLGTHAGAEILAVLVLRFAVLGLVEKLGLLERGLAGVDDDVILVVDDALQLPGAHVEHQAQAGGHALVEPDVRDGHGQFDVAHALAAHAAEGHFHAATVADDALVLDALVLAARAFPVARGAEDALAEQAAFFGLERAVIDRLRVFDLALAPGADRVGRSHGDADLVKADGAFFSEDFTKVVFVHRCWLAAWVRQPGIRRFLRKLFVEMGGSATDDRHLDKC